VPISTISRSAVRCCTPGIVHSSSEAAAKGRSCSKLGPQKAGFGQLAPPRRVRDIRLAARDKQLHRLHELRPSLREAVTVTAAHHPLAGMCLVVEGRRAVGGVACVIVRLPDGTPGTIPLSATSATVAGDTDAPAGGLLPQDSASTPHHAQHHQRARCAGSRFRSSRQA
jgi:hypothetical protein